MDITQSKYFTYGSADTNAASKSGWIQYALYEPITDRFVITSKHKEPLLMLSLLFSSRYQFSLVRLDTAKNFEINKVDNSCCYNWTFDKKDLIINGMIQEFTQTSEFDATYLIESDPIADDDLIVRDQEYLLAAFQWVSRWEYREDKTLSMDPFYMSELKLKEFLGSLPFPESDSTGMMHKMYKIIFDEFDFSVAEKLITKMQEKYDYEATIREVIIR